MLLPGGLCMSDLESVLDKVLVNSGERKFLVIIYGKAMKNNEFTQSQSSLIATIAISFGHYPRRGDKIRR